MNALISHQIQPFCLPTQFQKKFSHPPPQILLHLPINKTPKSPPTIHSINKTHNESSTATSNKDDDDDGIPSDQVKTLAKFKSLHNQIRVVEVSRREKENPDRLFVHVGDALGAEVGVEGGFAGLLVDLFAKGSVVPELQDVGTWVGIRGKLRRGGMVMVNCGGSCVEPEDPRREGRLVMEKTLGAMSEVFGEEELLVLELGRGKEDSCLALAGPGRRLDKMAWKAALPSEVLKCYVDMWLPYHGSWMMDDG